MFSYLSEMLKESSDSLSSRVSLQKECISKVETIKGKNMERLKLLLFSFVEKSIRWLPVNTLKLGVRNHVAILMMRKCLLVIKRVSFSLEGKLILP